MHLIGNSTYLKGAIQDHHGALVVVFFSPTFGFALTVIHDIQSTLTLERQLVQDIFTLNICV